MAKQTTQPTKPKKAPVKEIAILKAIAFEYQIANPQLSWDECLIRAEKELKNEQNA